MDNSVNDNSSVRETREQFNGLFSNYQHEASGKDSSMSFVFNHRQQICFSLLSLAVSFLSLFLFFVSRNSNLLHGLVAEPSTFKDIGVVRQGQSTSVSFVLRNRSSGPVEVIDVSTTCGCSDGAINPKQIAPGETASMTMTFRSGVSQGSLSIGADVFYRIEGQPDVFNIPLKVSATIDPEYTVVPERLSFVAGVPGNAMILLRPARSAVVGVRQVSCNKRYFSAEIDTAGMTDGAAVKVIFNPTDFYPDSGPATLIVTTDNDLAPIITIPISVAEKRQ
jgi:hypothetical protein